MPVDDRIMALEAVTTVPASADEVEHVVPAPAAPAQVEAAQAELAALSMEGAEAGAAGARPQRGGGVGPCPPGSRLRQQRRGSLTLGRCLGLPNRCRLARPAPLLPRSGARAARRGRRGGGGGARCAAGRVRLCRRAAARVGRRCSPTTRPCRLSLPNRYRSACPLPPAAVEPEQPTAAEEGPPKKKNKPSHRPSSQPLTPADSGRRQVRNRKASAKQAEVETAAKAEAAAKAAAAAKKGKGKARR